MDRNDAAPATKGDIKELRQEFKTDIRETRRVLAGEIVKTGARMDTLVDGIRADITRSSSRILTAVEEFSSQAQKVDRDQIITNYRVDELEKRVKALE